MKSNRKKRIIAAVLCMVMVLSSNISALAGEELFIDTPATVEEMSSEPAAVSDAESEVVMEDPEIVSETEEIEMLSDEAVSEPLEVTESNAPSESTMAETEIPAEVSFSDGESEETPSAEATPEEEPNPTPEQQPEAESQPEAEQQPETDFGDGAGAEEQILSGATELKQEFADAEGNVIQKVTANLPVGAFAAETSAITMEVNYLDTDSANYMKSMMTERVSEGMELGSYVFFDIQFKVNGEKAEALQPITITIEGSGLNITDTKKATVFYFDPADAAVEGDKDELKEIPQRAEVLESLQAAGQGTENIEDYDLSEITFREDGTTDKVIFEGRKSTIYGCYTEEVKPAEENPEETDGVEVVADEMVTPGKIEVVSEEANIRETPSTQAVILTTVGKGTQLDVLEETSNEEGTWYKINYEGIEGYINGECVTEISDKPEVITRYDYKSEDVNVLVTLTDPADLPDNAELSVTPVTISKTAEEQIEEEAIKEKKAIENIVAYDIKFLVDGQEIQPGATVNVQVSLPTIEAGQDAAVYHVDENDAVENMDGSVNEEGNVTFDTPHFSVYVIVQQGENEVTVTIEHYDNSNLENPVEIYQKDVLTLPVGGKINNYAKAANWDVAKVMKVAVNGMEIPVDITKEISVSSDKTFKVYYTPKKTTTRGAVSFYDYTMKAGTYTYMDPNTRKQVTKNYSINSKENYGSASEASNKLAVGEEKFVYPEHKGEQNGYKCIVNGKDANDWLGSGVTKPDQMVKGLITGLDSQGNVQFSVPEPGLFVNSDLTFEDPYTKETRYLRKYYNDYQLEFDQTGDTYKLTKVYDGKNTQVASAGNRFFPMNSVLPTYNEYGDTKNRQNSSDNLYFGMRYDVSFKIGDYMGPLNYKFTGDDDLVVLLDGKQAVIDLGGIHDACTDSVDLWNYILTEGQKVSDLTIDQKEQEHTLTILYMERGGYASNCSMEFTLPSARISEVTSVPMADLVLKKVNKNNEALAGARFTLKNQNGAVVASAISTADGAVKFSKLREGTYTLTEDVAPTGYIPTLDSWIVKVVVNSDEAAVATLYLSDGETEYSKKTGSVYDILNVTKQELIDSSMNYNKTAHVKDWDKRTYDINITASSKLTSSTSVEKDAVIDMMLVFDTSGSMLANGKQSDKNGFIKVGEFKQTKDKLDTTKLYYYTDSLKTVYYEDYEYSNAARPMIFMDGKWQYYDNGTWKEVSGDSEKTIYTLNSNLNALKEAATSFVNSAAAASSSSRLGVATFNYVHKLEQELTALNSDSAKQIVKNINSLTASGGTSPQLGLEDAYNELNSNKKQDVPQYVILFSDGAPSSSGDRTATETQADKIKEAGIVIYTVGLGLNDDTAKWLSESVASEGCAFTADTADELKEIFKKIQGTITQNLDIKNAQIKDVIDPRFVILDDSGSPITEEYPGIENGVTLANGGKVTYVEDENGNKYQQIVWTEQTIPYNKDGKQWKQTFTVAAKEEYIGGNNVTTNISPDSSITTSYGDAVLPQPTVNVKSDLIVNDKEVTIYYGDKVPTEETILNTLFDVGSPQGIITTVNSENKIVTYTMGSDGKQINPKDFILKWYQDEQCTEEITLDAMKETIPAPEEQKYYLKVSYNALGESTEQSSSNTDNNIATGEAHHETVLNQKYGVYTVKVVQGQIKITKTLDKPLGQDEEFTFTINRVEDNEEKAIATVTVTVKSGDTTASYKYTPAEGDTSGTDPLSGLKRGTYVVREENSDSFDVQKVIVTDATNCYSTTDAEKATFVLGNNKENQNVISKEYAYNGEGILGEVSFTNEKIMKNWKIVKTSTSSPDNPIVLQGAEFSLTPQQDNNNQKTYIGVSGQDGAVVWYETDGQGNKTENTVEKFVPGFYTLAETKAPSGYVKSDDEWTVRLSAKGYLISIDGAEKPTISSENGTTTYKFYFKNTPVYDLPSSGGNGIFGYMTSGVALMMAAMFILYKMRRKGVLRS